MIGWITATLRTASARIRFGHTDHGRFEGKRSSSESGFMQLALCPEASGFPQGQVQRFRGSFYIPKVEPAFRLRGAGFHPELRGEGARVLQAGAPVPNHTACKPAWACHEVTSVHLKVVDTPLVPRAHMRKPFFSSCLSPLLPPVHARASAQRLNRV